MKRRTFLAGLTASAVYLSAQDARAQEKVFLPIILNDSVEQPRIGIGTDWQLSQTPDAMKNRSVDFWIIAGDLTYSTFDPVESNTKWQGTISQLNTLGKPYYAVPGNHDWVSGSVAPFSTPPAHAVTQWQQYIGNSQFVVETDTIKFIGLDYLNWSQVNQSWLAAQLQTAKRRVVVSHYPLLGCWHHYAVTPYFWDWWDQFYVDKLNFMTTNGVELFLAGHRHQFSLTRHGAMTHVICPSVAPVVGTNLPEPITSGVIPFTIPVQGWLELTDSFIELFRQDGISLGMFGW